MMHGLWDKWTKDEAGVAAAEFALVFPVMLVLLVATFDLGNGILVNQKTIAAAQSVADLLGRTTTVTDDILEESIRAGELSIEPFPLGDFGIDIVSVCFDENDSPQVVWRETRNMGEDGDAVNSTIGLGTEGDGVVVVVATYNFQPSFSVWSIGDIDMREAAFVRGRRAAVVKRTGVSSGTCGG